MEIESIRDAPEMINARRDWIPGSRSVPILAMDKCFGWGAILTRRNGIEMGGIDAIQGSDSQKIDVAPLFVLRRGAEIEVIKASDCGGEKHVGYKSGVIDRLEE